MRGQEPVRTRVVGIAASHGVAVGAVRVAGAGAIETPRRRIAADLIELEVERFQRAVDASRAEIEAARGLLEGRDGGAKWSLILDAHLLMHRDELVVDAAVAVMREDLVNAEWALRRTVDGLRERLLAAESSLFRDRAQDVEHVARHILRWLAGGRSALPFLPGPRVLVADDLSPADAARLGALPVLALVTELGSTTSHTAILARALGVPAVVGASGVLARVAEGDVVVVDALRGEVVLAPSPEECERAAERGRRHRDFTELLKARSREPARTADGARVTLLANLDLPVEAALLGDTGAEGVGLYRTEFLYLECAGAPTEAQQYAVYRDVVEAVSPGPVTFRTCDLGADKLPETQATPRGQNPALGLRGVRLSLARPALLRDQVRAILRAATGGDVRILLPLVATVPEVRAVRALVDEERERLLEGGVPVPVVPLGVMIEVPSAALIADRLAGVADFFSVGTNDLVQYTLAADRGNPLVADLARPLHPGVLRLLHTVARVAGERGIPLSMCGDMASDPVALPVVLGLGYLTLSAPPAMLPLVREVVSRVDRGRAQALAGEALELESALAVRCLVHERMHASLGEIWEEEGIEPPPA